MPRLGWNAYTVNILSKWPCSQVGLISFESKYLRQIGRYTFFFLSSSFMTVMFTWIDVEPYSIPKPPSQICLEMMEFTAIMRKRNLAQWYFFSSEISLKIVFFFYTTGNGFTGPLNYYRAALRGTIDKRIFNPIEVPTLIVWGAKDLALNRNLPELSRKYIKNCTIKYVEEATHWVQMDGYEEVNKYIWEFVKP